MKRLLRIATIALTAVLLATSVMAADKKTASATKPPPGLEAAQTISLITGVAISPLLGVGAVGCYEFFKNAGKPEAERRQLNWYAHPWFWIPALLIVVLVMLKDVLGTGAPSALKKPMDVAESIENKISGLIAAGAFVPLITQIIPDASSTAQLSAMGFAAFDLASLFNAMMVPFAIAAFAVVWLAAHAINILILISPFTSVDLALKSFRMFLLSLVAATHFIDPYFGAIFSICLIIVAYFIAGWSFRLLVMGHVFIWDYVSFRRFRFTPKANGNWMFTSCKIGKTPIRTYGRLLADDQGGLTFAYHPWLFLPRKTLTLPAGKYAVGRSLFFPEIVLVESEDEERGIFYLPPRYRTHEEEVRRAYQFADVRDIGILKGLKNIGGWFKSLFGFKNKLQAAPAT